MKERELVRARVRGEVALEPGELGAAVLAPGDRPVEVRLKIALVAAIAVAPGSFEDVEAALRDSLERLRSAPELPARERIRGFVFDPETGTLRELPEG